MDNKNHDAAAPVPDIQPSPVQQLMSSQPIQYVQPQSIPQPSEFRVLRNGLIGQLGFQQNRFTLAQKAKALQLRSLGCTYRSIAMSTIPNASIPTVHRWQRQRSAVLKRLDELRRIRADRLLQRRANRFRRRLNEFVRRERLNGEVGDFNELWQAWVQ